MSLVIRNSILLKFIFVLFFVSGCSTDAILSSLPDPSTIEQESVDSDLYASIIMDAQSDLVLHEYRSRNLRRPASLTKLMTLYLTFEELSKGSIQESDKITISKRAHSRPPARLGLPIGSTITIEKAIESLIVHSANDIAVALSEHISGSEPAFAARMTRKARLLGMSSTTFRNASGLHSPDQWTTAYDMALLSIALRRHYPDYYHYFSRVSFDIGERSYKTRNEVLLKLDGATGLKTGYIRQSGHNLSVSVERDERYFIGIVMGEQTKARRDNTMISLLNFHLVE